ncbi:uncharacterized protein LOC120348893 [Nilaparvata lugens]|uniref:uncharacterized protein LOC120348893 n=1 Tax=Nilaparvata lugens TaxID=108931 RepID=UPI00193D6802|nr:uncharacterized protein LOC120348893 [Nilaparvata lugens]
MASQSEKASVISTMRACILSCKGGIQINALDRDYRSLEGSPIPYKMLGYSTLEALIKDTPDLHLKAGIVQADIAESSAHIAAMVNRQKSTAKSKARGKPPPSYSHKWGFSKSKPKYPPPRPPQSQPRYSAPAKMRTPSPPPHQYSNASASTPLSITIGVEDRQPRKVIVDRNNSDEGRSRGVYELPPRFHKTEANMKKGPRSLSANPQPNNDDLRETINKIKERHAQSKTDEPSNGDMPKPKFSENGVKTRKKSTSEEDSSKLPPKSPGLTRKPFFATQTSQELKEAKTKQDPAKVVPRWLRSNSKEDLDDINGVLYVDKLAQYINDHNMSGPVYKILQRQPKGGPLLYGCQIKVNDQNHSSYPDETMDAESAMELAAKKAYTKLIENEQFMISPVTVTND